MFCGWCAVVNGVTPPQHHLKRCTAAVLTAAACEPGMMKILSILTPRTTQCLREGCPACLTPAFGCLKSQSSEHLLVHACLCMLACACLLVLLQVAAGSLGLQGNPPAASHDPPGHGPRCCCHHSGQVGVHWPLQGGRPPTLGVLLHKALASQPVCDGKHWGGGLGCWL
jgi:hypothetical protein